MFEAHTTFLSRDASLSSFCSSFIHVSLVFYMYGAYDDTSSSAANVLVQNGWRGWVERNEMRRRDKRDRQRERERERERHRNVD